MLLFPRLTTSTTTSILLVTGLLLSSFQLSLVLGNTALDQPFTSSFIKLPHAPCVTLYYRHGRTGCGTAENGQLQEGALVYFDGDLPQTQDHKYVAVVEDYDLTYQTINTLLAARGGLLQGILVLNSTSSISEQKFYSPDSIYPQGYNTPSQQLQYGNYQYKWNPNGQDLFALDLYAIPMAYVMDSDVADSLRQESQSNQLDNADNSNVDHVVASFNYYMGGDAINSFKCLQWKDLDGEWNPKCLPLGGSSVWATAGTPPNPNKNNQNGPRPVIMIATGIDSTSMFHDLAPGANTAASNILTLLMAAKLLGTYVNDYTFDSLSSGILIAFFQGESYGFLGSRSFLNDLAGFQCGGSLVHSISRLGDKSEYACLNPIRPSMAFANLGKVQGMISVDQVAQQVGGGVLYSHADQNNDQMGKFLASCLYYSKTSTVSVAAASVNNNNNNYPYPPTPLTSLLQITQGGVGGAVLTGYDYEFSNKVKYHSQLDSAQYQSFSLKSIAAAATIVARAALAAAYDGGYNYDAQTAAQWAANLIPELDYQDESLNELADCLFYNGNCNLIQKYAQVEYNNDRTRTGLSVLGTMGDPLGVPPSYYVGVYSGQPFVQVAGSDNSNNLYGAYNGQEYGNKDSDAVGMMPRQLEAAIHGLLNDYLGRGSSNANNNGADNSASNNLVKCSKLADCANVDYCGSYGEYPVCTGGGYCVCKRAQYHVAMDEAIKPAVNKPTGFFEAKDSDAGISPLYTEPYWSNDVSIQVYRSVESWLPGFFTLIFGLAAGGASLFAAFVLKVGLKKEKLY